MILLPRQDYAGAKLGDNVRATYRRVGQTCPSSCEGLQEGWCYAMHGNVHLHAERSPRHTLDGVRLRGYIMAMEPGKLLRHHVAGDFFANDAPDMNYIEHMIAGHAIRPDIVGWSYTHGWRQLNPIKLNALGNLTVNASCDSLDAAVEARRQGWPATAVVDADAQGRKVDGTRLVICPAQTDGLTCAECRICFQSDRQCIVGFRVHGAGQDAFHEE